VEKPNQNGVSVVDTHTPQVLGFSFKYHFQGRTKGNNGKILIPHFKAMFMKAAFFFARAKETPSDPLFSQQTRKHFVN
jgi:hypothetical protein